MTELETLLLQQLEQQQRDSAKLVNELSGQLDRLQKALSDQQANNAALRREVAESDRRNAQAVNALTKRFEELSERLSNLGRTSSG